MHRGSKMKKKYMLVVLLGIAGVMLSGTIQAATVNIFESTGTPETVDSLSTWSTTGLDMTGMEVIVNYWGGGSETTSWDMTGAGTGAVGADWSLSILDPSLTTYYSGIWNLETSSSSGIASIILNGFDHNVVFDNDEVNYPGTAGSEWGIPFTTDYYATATTYAGNIDVTYSGGVAIAGSSVFGDLFQSMEINFRDGAFTAADSLTYYQDTDNLTNPVPEPATMLLFGVGIAGLVGSQIRRKKS